jgi:hypothetical protein
MAVLVLLRQMVGKGKIVLSKKVSTETPPHRQAAKRYAQVLKFTLRKRVNVKFKISLR